MMHCQLWGCAFTLPAFHHFIRFFLSILFDSVFWVSSACCLPYYYYYYCILFIYTYFGFMNLLFLSRFSHVLLSFSLFHLRRYIKFEFENDVGRKEARRGKNSNSINTSIRQIIITITIIIIKMQLLVQFRYFFQKRITVSVFVWCWVLAHVARRTAFCFIII